MKTDCKKIITTNIKIGKKKKSDLSYEYTNIGISKLTMEAHMQMNIEMMDRY